MQQLFFSDANYCIAFVGSLLLRLNLGSTSAIDLFMHLVTNCSTSQIDIYSDSP